MKIEASFITSAVSARDFPQDELAEIALVGRSNVGKSSLINALVRQKIARTSGEPGKTRLVNVYRVARGASRPVLLIDLPGYGYARRSKDGTALDFEALAGAYFGRAGQAGRPGQAGGDDMFQPGRPAPPGQPAPVSAVLIVDARHPGL